MTYKEDDDEDDLDIKFIYYNDIIMNENMDDNLVFNDIEPGGAKFAESIPEIKVVGVGGAGCNAVKLYVSSKDF